MRNKCQSVIEGFQVKNLDNDRETFCRLYVFTKSNNNKSWAKYRPTNKQISLWSHQRYWGSQDLRSQNPEKKEACWDDPNTTFPAQGNS